MLSTYLASWLMLVAVFSAAVVSPGPDFVMSLRNSLSFGRRAGLFTAVGFALGVLVHVAYTVVGIGALIAHSQLAFTIIKYAGAAYLLWLGFKAIRSRGTTETNMEAGLASQPAGRSDWLSLRDGFITNLMNPKATLFFVALFTQIIDPAMPVLLQTFFGLTCAVMVLAWFSLVTILMTQAPVRRRYIAASKWIDRAMGVMLIGFGLKLALSRS